MATLRRVAHDRVPLMLDGFQYASMAEVAAEPDPAKREIARRIYGLTTYTQETPSFINRYLVTPSQFIREVRREVQHGNLVVYSEIDTPGGKLTAATSRNPITDTVWTVKYPVETVEEAEMLRSVPWELPEGLEPPEIGGEIGDLRGRGIMTTRVSSPFVCVAGMMPFQTFLEWCATELPLIRELTAVCLARILDVLDVLLTPRCIEYVWMGGCEWLTPPMGSPRLYGELVQPFERQVIERVHAAGAISHIHCHGNVRSTLEQVIERGGDFFEPVEPPPDGDIAFDEAKSIVSGRMVLGGNIEARTIEYGTVDEAEGATRRAFRGDTQHMVLKMSEGPLHRLTPEMAANYHRIVDVWDELSDS
jgi:hypothetical protein